MNKTAVILLLVALSCGCARYQVAINGYRDVPIVAANAFRQGASFYIRPSKDQANPLLEAQIRNKIEQLLEFSGYRTVRTPEEADYYLAFTYQGGTPRTVSQLEPLPYSSTTRTIQTFTENGEVSTTVLIYPEFTDYTYRQVTVYTSQLRLYAIDPARRQDAANEEAVWIGESAYTDRDPDFREDINYLLAGLFRYFGDDTGRQVTTTLKPSDPRLELIQKK